VLEYWLLEYWLLGYWQREKDNEVRCQVFRQLGMRRSLTMSLLLGVNLAAATSYCDTHSSYPVRRYSCPETTCARAPGREVR
jgi:hypothetical protein